jgi:hypothetical protein
MKYSLAFLLIVTALFSCSRSTTELSCEVKEYKGRPTIFANGQPVSPVMYSLTDCPGGRNTWEERPARNLKNFTDAGFELFQLAVWFQDIWKPDGSLDINYVQKQIRGVLDANPNAIVFIRLHINAPFWWDKQNPDETTLFADGEALEMPEYWTLVRNTTGKDLSRTKIHSLASEKWRKETTEKLIEFCKRLSSTPEGNRLAGLHLCDGVSHEWHYWGFIEHDPDTGIPMTNYFRKWLTGKYNTDENLRKSWNNPSVSLQTAKVPGMKERDYTSAGVFRDPHKERYVIDYYEAQHRVVADDIIHFCRTVKENWPRPILTGVFYGYFFMMFSRQAVGGHLEMERILSSKYIDYLSAPQSYWYEARELGGGGNSRAVLGSLLLHHKLSLEENDQFTYFGSLEEKYWDTPKKKADSLVAIDIARIRRNTLRPFCEGVGQWYYDFGPNNGSGWWDMPDYMKNIRQLKTIIDRYNQKPYVQPADVLVVYDDKCYTQFKARWNAISEMSIDHLSSEMYKTGAITTNIYLFDLPEVDLSRYKVIVFANTWLITEEMKKFIKENVLSQPITVLWNYMPGFSNGSEINLQFVKDLTGFDLSLVSSDEKPELVITNKDYGSGTFRLQDILAPFPVVSDKQASLIGKFSNMDWVGLAFKKKGDVAIFYSSLPWQNPQMLRTIFRQAGAHIYSDSNDSFFAGAGLLGISAKNGGSKSILLTNGKTIQIKMNANSTAILDSETGEILLN